MGSTAVEISSSPSPIFDLEQVEVLRGPQGVLFGKNTIAGAVMSLLPPTEEFEGSVSAYWESEYDSGEALLLLAVLYPIL